MAKQSLIFGMWAVMVASSATSTETRPNFVFILTDDMSYSDMDVMPHLKELVAERGVTFNRYYINTPVCAPSRVTLLRGQYAHNTGVKNASGMDGGYESAVTNGIEDSTIATWLDDSGYNTCYVGKYINGYPGILPDTHIPPGWDEWYVPLGNDGDDQYNYTLNVNGTLVQYGASEQDYGNTVYFNKAISFVQNAAGAPDIPFFLYLNVHSPHHPATSAPPDTDLFPAAQVPRTAAFNEEDVADKPEWVQDLPLLAQEEIAGLDMVQRNRLRSLQSVDRGIEEVVNVLDTQGLLDETYIIFSSDNGFHLGQHRMPAGKQTAYETDTHVPLIISGPGVPVNVVISDLAGNTDIGSTIADLAEVPVPGFVDGRSLEPLLQGASSGWTRSAYLLNHWVSEPPSVLSGLAPELYGLRTKIHTYVYYPLTGERELYNNNIDPEQINNLANVRPLLVGLLHQTLVGLIGCESGDCRAAEDHFFIPGSPLRVDGWQEYE